ncbi:MAG: peptidylprolyl isomerase [Candidatus Competibacteraceae bacterium]|nr:peptidylprolyl isomerase [Candidatus Competibacteraceae bacterium]MBK8896254.1 peptidylprolyl isomerase [Candidatus Competibacteraceae bacterium]MBK8964936.1 peptidylprolyl isomerase [Candidatus Competibacteraceae bacterium]MBK9950218.1 peptidylprolyl isomerase [Candidatus Competibacteraceae bacterium]
MKINKLTFPLLALSSALLLSGAALAADDKKAEAAAPTAPTAPTALTAPAPPAKPVEFTIPDPVAVVNGKPIPKAAFEQYVQQLRGRTKVDSPEASKSLIDQLVLEELLVQQADKQKLAETPEIKQQLAMVQRSLLASSVIRRMLNDNAPGEDAIKKEYETATAAMKGKEYKASHILVDSEDKAKEIIAELKKGGNFAELAKAKSSDSSKDNGGDLGWFTPSMMVPPFAQAVAKMEKGKYSEQPVQTSFGWHVIQLEDIRDATPPSLDELKPQITQMLQSRMVNDYLEKLKADAKVDVKEIQVSEAAKPAAEPAKTVKEEKKEEKK